MKAQNLKKKFAKAALKMEEARAREMEDYANQRVIEELEKVISNLDSPWDRDMVRRRIKELMKIGANQKK